MSSRGSFVRVALPLAILVFVAALALLSRAQGPGSPAGPARRLAGPADAGSSGAAAQPAANSSPQPNSSGPQSGELASAASFDGDVRALPQVGPANKHAMPEPESLAWESRIAAFQPGIDFVDPARQAAIGSLAVPAPSQNFKGLDFANWGGGWPPDTNGDIGPNHYIQTVNTSIGIFNKSGTRLAAFSFNTFFGAA